MRALTLLALSALFLPACGGDDADGGDPPVDVGDPTLEPGQVEVLHYRVPCQGESRQLCLQVRAYGKASFENFYSEIEGFDFVWGEHAVLAVRQEAVDAPAADGADVRYVLDDIVATRPVVAAFELTLDGQDFTAAGPATLTLLDGSTAACASADLCRIIASRAGDSPALVRMRATGQPGDPISIFRVMQ
ncbi:MAG: DUF4377 domain-containing protein [bacterium]